MNPGSNFCMEEAFSVSIKLPHSFAARHGGFEACGMLAGLRDHAVGRTVVRRVRTASISSTRITSMLARRMRWTRRDFASLFRLQRTCSVCFLIRAVLVAWVAFSAPTA